MGVSFSEFVLWLLFPVIASLVLFIAMIVQGRGGKAFFSLSMILLFFYVVDSSFPNGAGIILYLFFGPWLVCITMFLAYLFKTKKKPDIVLERESHPNEYYTRRVLDPCLFYGNDGRRLNYEESLNYLNSLDVNACNDFLSSIGYPHTRKGESLDQSRQRCVDAYKKEYIK
ncbi:MAG: hypothetical protein HY254_16160 [Burkholderiales bacterium]|nr:hypothetical protein [Burkholderiales bacterium]